MKLMSPLYVFVIFGQLISACSFEKDNSTERIITEYYKVYNKRQNINTFIDFYDEDILFEDIINGDRIEGKENLKLFLDWNNPNFIKLDSNNLIIIEKIIQEDKAIVKGYFTKFRWGKMEFGPIHFTSILTLNDSKKIIKQVDWINYPANLVDYNTRKDSNHWIK